MALALYRKYRPRTFSEVIGQEHVTEPLTQALRSGRLHHAYLFSGPRGCGKTSSARILARSLNCVKGPTPDPCGECDSCRALAPDGPGSIDVIEIDAASHGGVDDARDLRERAFFAPVSSRYKVYVIDEAHMVSTQGFNALLKLVEEPPEYVTFIFATTEPEKVLGTIRSRTHHYPFRLIPPNVLRPYLEKLCREEGVSVEPAVFPLVVRAGGGSVRDSLSVLDQLIAGAGPAGVSYARALGLLGVTDVALIDEMCDALAAEDGATAYATIDRLVEAGHDPRRFAGDLLERLRDLIILQRVPDAAVKGLIDAPADQLDRMAAQAQRFGPAALSRCADLVHAGLTEMRGATAPRLLMELVVARMLLPGADDGGPALLHRLERMERRLTAANEAPAGATGPPPAVEAAPVRPAALPAPTAATRPVPPAAASREPAPPAPATAASPASVSAASVPAPDADRAAEPGALDAAGVRRVWDEILTMVGRRSKRAAAVVREATVRDVDGDVLVLLFKHSVHADMLATSPDLLLEAVHEVLGGTWRLRCEHPGGTGPAPVVGGSGGRPGAGEAPGDSRGSGDGSRRTGRAAGGRPGGAPADGRSGGGADGRLGGTGHTGGQGDVAGGGGTGDTAGGPGGTGRPGGRTSGRAPGRPEGPAGTPPAVANQAGPVDDDEEWPATALPGGIAPAAGPPEPVAAGRPMTGHAAAGAATPGRAAATRAGARAGGGTAVRGAGPARRGAASPGTGGGSSPSARRAGAGDPGWADVPPPDEPPYDPDYDAAPPPTYEGFDPGDEPTDEVVDEQAARQSSEQQALDLLRQTLGAEKIGEIGG